MTQMNADRYNPPKLKGISNRWRRARGAERGAQSAGREARGEKRKGPGTGPGTEKGRALDLERAQGERQLMVNRQGLM